MAGKRLGALNFSRSCQFEALGRTSVGFHLGHDVTPFTSISLTVKGGFK
jgi:hypothetical protein